MQVIIDQVISHIRAFDSNLAPETMRRLVEAVLEALDKERWHRKNSAEEQLSSNWQQLNPPGRPWMG